MSDMASVQFRGPSGDLSCVVFSQWGRALLHMVAEEFAELITKGANRSNYGSTPVDRFEPDAVLAKFIAAAMADAPDIVSRIQPPDQIYRDSAHLVITLPYKKPKRRTKPYYDPTGGVPASNLADAYNFDLG